MTEHKNIFPPQPIDSEPWFAPGSWVAPTAVVIGQVSLGRGASVWYGAVLRGDLCSITVGEDSNVQDNCTVHGDPERPVVLGNRVSVGHGTILHGCEIGDDSVIGMGSVVLNGAKIGKNCLIGAGSLVTKNTVIPDGSMAFGRPARVIRAMTREDLAYNDKNWREYRELLANL